MQSLVRLFGLVMGVKCLSLEHNDALPSIRTHQRVEKLAVANSQFYTLICTAASSMSVKSLSKDIAARYAHCKH